MAENSADRALLRRFEPVLKFTEGEAFFPYDVAEYVAQSSLWVKEPDVPPRELIAERALDLHRLGTVGQAPPGGIHFLQFISPMNVRELAEFQFQKLRAARKSRSFKAARSRLTRVGYMARFVDALFSISLLLRGRVPGDSMAAAMVTFNDMLRERRAFQYYGRVLRENGWTILQYWFFYPFNNWRSGFNGGNDHEADWEMITLYLSEDSEGALAPYWVAYACHDFSGADLRRHWQDPEVEKQGEHPVVYVGGGSHASYFQPGEYLTQISIPFLTPLKSFVNRVEKVFAQVFNEKQAREDKSSDRINVFRVPFVDFARGDGLCIGPGCPEVWLEPTVISPPPPWVANYRGLWGYYAQDPFSGEDAPAGPMVQRDGSVRQAWYDPLSWAGMDSVVPPAEWEGLLRTRQEETRDAIRLLHREINRLQGEVFETSLDIQAMRGISHLCKAMQAAQEALDDKRDILSQKRHAITVKQALLTALIQQQESLQQDDARSRRQHLSHPHRPHVKQSLRFGRFAEFWAAISIGLMMIAVVLLFLFARRYLFLGISSLFLLLLIIEAAFRRRVWALTRHIAIFLAVVALLILLYEFFLMAAAILIMLAGLYMIIENLRELFERA
jgi:hypothetical protein